mgnify:CR=1 FL=1
MNKLPPYTLKRTSTFKAHVKLAKRRGLDLSLLEEIIDKLVNRIPLEEKNHDNELTVITKVLGNVISSQIGF